MAASLHYLFNLFTPTLTLPLKGEGTFEIVSTVTLSARFVRGQRSREPPVHIPQNVTARRGKR